MNKEISIKSVNNGFVVCFDTPSRMSPFIVKKIGGEALPPEVQEAMSQMVGELVERTGVHDHEHLVFTDLLSLVNWLNKYFSKEAV